MTLLHEVEVDQACPSAFEVWPLAESAESMEPQDTGTNQFDPKKCRISCWLGQGLYVALRCSNQI